MFNRQAAAALNHVLSNADWARAELRAFHDSVLEIRLDSIALRLAITGEGRFAAADASASTALLVQIDPLMAARLLGGDTAARNLVRTSGDDSFASVIWHVFNNLRWDVEADLATLLGDPLAHRVARLAQSMVGTARDSGPRVAQAAVEYLTEESRLSPPCAEIDAFLGDVDLLRDAVERMEQRIELMERGLRQDG
jgi:ubiquinone biosynthesis protein UbiJ